MTDSPALPVRCFLGWNAPALDLVTRRLLEWQERAPLEFCRATLVVPSAESGRRLREHMAAVSAPRPLLMPRVCLAEQLLRPDPQTTASEMETQAAWLAELEESERAATEGSAWRELFPKPPENPLPVWAEATATMLRNLRRRLEQENATAAYGEAWRQLGTTVSGEKLRRYTERMGERWEPLQALWERVDARIRSLGKRTAEEARAALVAAPPPFRGRVVFLCVPELSAQLRAYLAQAIRAGAVVELWINAPAGEQNNVDDWGQPRLDWAQREIPLPPMADDGSHPTLHLVQNARAMALRAIELADGCTPQQVALVSCDRSMDAALCYHFAHPSKGEPWQLFVPAGRSLSGTEPARLPTMLREAMTAVAEEAAAERDDSKDQLHLNEEEALRAVLALLHSALWLRATGFEGEPTAAMQELDELCHRHLPSKLARLEQLLQHRPLQAVLRRTLEWLRALHEPQQAPGAWAELASALQAAPASPALALLSAQIEQLSRFLTAQQDFPPRLALRLLEHGMACGLNAATEPLQAKHDTHADLLGWREALFAAAPRLIICGAHSDCLPEPAPEHAMLPNALCGALGITAAEQREAREAFLLSALLHSRREGDLHFVVARQQDDGTPIQPSPLLLRARGKELARRARYLFGDAPEPPAEMPDEGWLLLPSRRPVAGQVEAIDLLGDGSAHNPYAAPNATFSASELNCFLRCPLRFWLQTLYSVDSGKLYEEEKVDMDNAEYGSFMHEVLCAFTQRYPSLRELGEGDGKQELQELLRTAFCKDYGSEWSLPLQNQYELLDASLMSFADWHRQELEKGWQTVAQELELYVPLSLGEDAAPAVFRMKLDRVDYHPGEQRWRIIDYKTHDHAPDHDYYATLPPDSRFEALLPQLTLMPKFLRGRRTDQKVRWCNLQLPLYAYGLQMQQNADAPPEALRRLFDTDPKARAALDAIPELAYVNLPKKHKEVELNPLNNTCKEPLGEDDMTLALDWARTLCGFLRRGECLLSAEALELPYQAYDKETLLTEHDPRQLCGLPTPPDHA